MANTLDLPTKGTRHMDEGELCAEAERFGIEAGDDVEELRRALKAELERRWREENREAIRSINAWVEKNGLPLEKYRVW
jgi:antitoxin CcdA